MKANFKIFLISMLSFIICLIPIHAMDIESNDNGIVIQVNREGKPIETDDERWVYYSKLDKVVLLNGNFKFTSYPVSCTVENHGTIVDGIFYSPIYNYGMVNDGAFYGTFYNTTKGKINFGMFYEHVFNENGGTIKKGSFYNKVRHCKKFIF